MRMLYVPIFIVIVVTYRYVQHSGRDTKNLSLPIHSQFASSMSSLKALLFFFIVIVVIYRYVQHSGGRSTKNLSPPIHLHLAIRVLQSMGMVIFHLSCVQ